MTSLTGQLLIAMPQLHDPFFARSVVYLCAHSEEEGAMGLIVNKTIDSLTIDELYAQLEIEPVDRSKHGATCILAARSLPARALYCTAPITATRARWVSAMNSP